MYRGGGGSNGTYVPFKERAGLGIWDIKGKAFSSQRWENEYLITKRLLVPFRDSRAMKAGLQLLLPHLALML